MTMARDGGPAWASRRLAVETPEQVVLELELAGAGSRFGAALIDAAIILLLLLGLLLAGSLAGVGGTWFVALVILVIFGVVWGYFLLFEALRDGRTPGKRALGIRVVMDTGHRLTLGASAVRNLVRAVDMQPGGSYLVGLAFVMLHPQHKRLGDIVAGTIVVRDNPMETPLAIQADAAPRAQEHTTALADAGAPLLADDEFRLVEQFLARRDGLEVEVRVRLARDLAARFEVHRQGRPGGPETLLERLQLEERRRRAGRMAGARGGGPAVSGAATSVAARFAARKQASWERFRREALAAERDGLTGMDGAALTAFAARYREVAADLARARTYGADQAMTGYLERIVSAGHNALYGLRGVRRVPALTLLFRELPAATYRARRYVRAAFLLFIVPAVTGYFLLRGAPDLAPRILPDEMISRAEAGARSRAAGVGYAESPEFFLPIVASSIIANNVQVTFVAFAGGITAGVGTALVLVFNGLFLGAIMGLFANYGVAGWLLTFVAGHGVLELTAIFMAGGAGLLVARALVAPGDWSRRDALVVHGRLAIQVVAAAALLLVLAGVIEGLLSASGAPPVFKLFVSAASAVLLVLLWLAGRRFSAERAPGAPPLP
jgi:uncharacterized membrane protein SpoIIM required for sporulation/uncharacterized RDD family membrane protein YckC